VTLDRPLRLLIDDFSFSLSLSKGCAAMRRREMVRVREGDSSAGVLE
jgi:hypothetical protein